MATRKAGLTMGAALKASTGAKGERIQLADLKLDGGTQPRQQIDEATVSAYVERMERQRGEVIDPEGKPFDPIVVFFDGESYWLADGFHRVAAARKKNWSDYPADIRQGTLRDAVAYSLGANARHGKPRTNADKRRAVTRALVDKEWSQLGVRELARMCAVSPTMVSNVRDELERARLDMRVSTNDTFSTTAETTEQDAIIEGIEQHAPPRAFKRGAGGGLSELHRQPAAPATYEPNPLPLEMLGQERATPTPTPTPLEIPQVRSSLLKDAPNGKLAALIVREPMPIPMARAIERRQILKPHGVYLMALFNDSVAPYHGALLSLDSEWLLRIVSVDRSLWAVLHRRGALFPNHFKDEDSLLNELRQMDGDIWEMK